MLPIALNSSSLRGHSRWGYRRHADARILGRPRQSVSVEASVRATPSCASCKRQADGRGGVVRWCAPNHGSRPMSHRWKSVELDGRGTDGRERREGTQDHGAFNGPQDALNRVENRDMFSLLHKRARAQYMCAWRGQAWPRPASADGCFLNHIPSRTAGVHQLAIGRASRQGGIVMSAAIATGFGPGTADPGRMCPRTAGCRLYMLWGTGSVKRCGCMLRSSSPSSRPLSPCTPEI